MTPLDRLRAARKVYSDMLTRAVTSDECDLLRSNIEALDSKIRRLEGVNRK